MCRRKPHALGALVVLIAAVWAGPSRADESTAAGALAARPMAITAQSMTVKNLDHRVIFDRDVKIVKGDMDLQADRVEVILARPSGPIGKSPLRGNGAGPDMLSEEKIERIVADGRVKVVQGKKTATADHAVYHRAEETIVLTGRPETWEEGVRIQGSKITILLKEQRSVVEESRVVIYPETASGAGSEPAPPQTAHGE
jgi:lipopolysaccharide export system protein LptA